MADYGHYMGTQFGRIFENGGRIIALIFGQGNRMVLRARMCRQTGIRAGFFTTVKILARMRPVWRGGKRIAGYIIPGGPRRERAAGARRGKGVIIHH